MKSLIFLKPVFTLSQVVTHYFVGQVIPVIINYILRRLTIMISRHNGVSEAYDNLLRNIISTMISNRDKRKLRRAASIITNSNNHEAYFASLLSKEDVDAIQRAKMAQIDYTAQFGGKLND